MGWVGGLGGLDESLVGWVGWLGGRRLLAPHHLRHGKRLNGHGATVPAGVALWVCGGIDAAAY